jgi:autophagy-related protein 13
VQDIDSRKPLSGRFRTRDRNSIQQDSDQDRDQDPNKEMGAVVGADEDREQRGSRRGGITVGSGEGSSQGPMLTNELDVDERLRQMNAAFLASLEGLNLGRREGRTEQDESQPEGQREEGEWSAGSAARGGGSGARRGRIHVDTRGESSRGMVDPSSYGGSGSGRGQMLLLAQHSPGSGSTNSSTGAGQGSEEVIGRLELDDGQPRSRRPLDR